jgi:hypothetical protein
MKEQKEVDGINGWWNHMMSLEGKRNLRCKNE